MIKVLNHLKLITVHKWKVFKNCCYAGIPLQGILHDLSKYSPTEFIESIKYYTGDHSPIDECKKINGYSMAWYHHRGRNKHHWEFWVDNFEKGITAPIIPYKYAVEMICDFLSAGQVYQKENWSFESEYKWWKCKLKTAVMHPVIARFVDHTLAMMVLHNSYTPLQKQYTLARYKLLVKAYHDGTLENEYDFYPENIHEI